jgi:hypothetical protein
MGSENVTLTVVNDVPPTALTTVGALVSGNTVNVATVLVAMQSELLTVA